MRWEYLVVSFQDGRYTEPLNRYGSEGWELVAVTPNVTPVAPPERGRPVPMPRSLGRIEDAATKIAKLGDEQSTEQAGDVLLWILRRPLDED